MIRLVQGGKALGGFLSGFAGSLLGGFAKGLKNVDPTIKTIIVAIAGGTASVLGGGKFANGAMSAAFIFMFNHMGKVGAMKSTLKAKSKVKSWFESLNKANNGAELERIYKDGLANFKNWLDNNPDSPNRTQVKIMQIEYTHDMEYATLKFLLTGEIPIKRTDGTWTK